MSQLPGQPPREQKPPLYTWSEVWTAVVTKPSVKTFSEILRDPAALPRRGLSWMYLTTCFSFFVILTTLFNDPAVRDQLVEMLPSNVSSTEFFSSLWINILCMLPFAALLNMGVFLAMVYSIQFIAGRVGSPEQTQNKLPKLIYMLAAILAPINILSLLLVILNTLGSSTLTMIFTLVWLGYQVTLMLFGVMAVYGFRTKQAAIAFGIPFAAYILLLLFFMGF